MMDLEQFIANRNAFASEELAGLVGKHVAWSPDGTRIVACDDDPLKVIAAVKAAGFDPRETLIEAITSPDEISLGGASLHHAVAEATA
jgi:hypothetical protein